MAGKNDKRVSSSDSGRKGIAWYFFSLPMIVFTALFFSALISTLIEWGGMITEVWEEPGVMHSQNMVSAEIKILNHRLDKNVLENVSGVTVRDIFDKTVGMIYSGFKELGVIHLASADRPRYTQGGGDYLGAAINMILLTFIRALVFLFASPCFLIFAWVGFVIGAFERDKRRAGGGRESGAIFQLARSSVAPAIGTAFFLYLASPWTIDPVYIVTPFAVLTAIAISYTAASYKKYT